MATVAIVHPQPVPASETITLPGNLQDGGIGVHPDDATLRTDQMGGQQGYISGSAPHIKHLHACFDACSLKEPAGRGCEQACLSLESFRFFVCVPGKIGRIISIFFTHSQESFLTPSS